MRELAKSIYAIDGLKTGRSYLIEDHEGLALIDTSSRNASSGIITAIEAIGRRIEELRTIIATHYHFDHTGNAGALIDRSGAELFVHEADAAYVEGRRRWMLNKGVLGP